MSNRQRIVISKVQYIIGRWNDKRNKCEYVSGYKYAWRDNIQRATVFNKEDITPKFIKHRSEKFTQIFISKVFCVQRYNGGRHLTLTSPNIWQNMDAVTNNI